jgi:hypothetical protein
MLIDLFERIESFFKRLESYTEVKPSEDMTDMMVKILVEVLSVLAIVTAEIKQKRRSQFISSDFGSSLKVFVEKFLKKLLGRNDVEDALKRLDKLTQEEARMAMAETLKITRGVDGNVKVLMDGAQTEFLVIQALMVYITRWQRRKTFVIFNLTTSLFRASLITTGKQMRRDLHSWLSPPDSSTNHNISRNAHHEGTATWFFEGGIYKEWRSTPSLLWVHGKRTSSSLFTA